MQCSMWALRGLLMTRASDAFFDAYLTCALWSSTDDNGNPLDGLGHAVPQKTRKAMRADCDAFVALCAERGERWDYGDPQYTDDEKAGHDFWLTRNGHGAGFWDRGLANGEALSALAKSFGSADLYVHRGRIYVA